MSILWYKRPDYVAKVPGPMNLTQCQIYVERTQKHKRAIPPELSFENVIQNKALPPCALQDFMVSTLHGIFKSKLILQSPSILISGQCRITLSMSLTMPRIFNSGCGFRITPGGSTRPPGQSRVCHRHGINSKHRSQAAPSRNPPSLFSLFLCRRRSRNPASLHMRSILTASRLRYRLPLHSSTSNLLSRERQASPRPVSQSQCRMQTPRWVLNGNHVWLLRLTNRCFTTDRARSYHSTFPIGNQPRNLTLPSS